ncbi:hypothetical protein [uncultured Meiothermus sp.]|jgi:hypothetical protein|uniref:hypothetical protein n=1 Tax=uncultured Meiothermus sp. TaxID=157471 RepID=UPI00261E6E36|nr:hypothetical protein [uncultured Meiothermus sp.]
MPSARALAAQRAGERKQDRSSNLAEALRVLHGHQGQIVELSCADLVIRVRYDGPETSEAGAAGVGPRYSIYLYALSEWMPISGRTLRDYLAMYGPYTWEVRDERP